MNVTIEVNGIDTKGSVFSTFEAIAKQKIGDAERKQETQRQAIAIDRDAAKIAGELTDKFYQLVNDSV